MGLFTIVFGAIILLAFIIFAVSDDDGDLVGLGLIAGLISTFLIMYGITEHVDKQSYKQGQIDALNSEYKYKKSIQYEYKDSNYIPVDTVYIEIE